MAEDVGEPQSEVTAWFIAFEYPGTRIGRRDDARPSVTLIGSGCHDGL